MLQIGARAPRFRLQDHLGRTVELAACLQRRHLLLVFYPADFTPT